MAKKGKIDTIVKEWKLLGIVKETNSSYSSLVILAIKKDIEPHYQKLNQQIIKKSFSIA